MMTQRTTLYCSDSLAPTVQVDHQLETTASTEASENQQQTAATFTVSIGRNIHARINNNVQGIWENLSLVGKNLPQMFNFNGFGVPIPHLYTDCGE